MHLQGPGYLVQGNPQVTNVMVVITGARTAILVCEHPPDHFAPSCDSFKAFILFGLQCEFLMCCAIK